MEGTLMEFVFTASIKGLGGREVAEENSFALLDGFEGTHPEAGAAVGADLATERLEVTFSATGHSFDEAAAKARQIFAAAAAASGLDSIEVVGFELETELTQRAG
ncbi:MAG TPA: hypothetical protein VGK66_06445 [Solirubrobacterales bacterium]|nr:hypothetical protein [Solirubrobacterales bacterium]